MQQSCTLRQTEHSYRRVGRHRLHEPADALHLRSSGALLLPHDRDRRGVRGTSHNRRAPLASREVSVPGIAESPVNIECRVRQITPLGSHNLILADVVAVTIDDAYMDEAGKFHLNDTGLITYSHGEYFLLGKKLGTFGYSVRKDTPGKRSNSLKGDDRKKKSRKNKSFPQKPSRVKEKLPGQKGILQQKNMKTDQNNFR